MARKNENSGISDDELIAAALAAYGIDPKYMFNSRIDEQTGEVVIVTNGGKKVRFTSGQKVEKLSEVDITGINPAAGKRKAIAGKAKE